MIESESRDSWSLDDAVSWLMSRVENGEKCPCCGQYAKIYRRKISSGMARLMIAQWLAVGNEWAHTVRVTNVSREGAKLAYWGLMEAEGGLREDGGHNGRWRITLTGRDWLMGATTVPKYAHIYNNRVLRHSGSEIGIQQALGTRFNYAELMAGV